MPDLRKSDDLDFDVIVIGAGISGINAAYRIQQQCPSAMYTVLEGRHTVGGTWDLWRYPGIRSDSDVFTFSFEWNPWPGPSTLARGDDFKSYMVRSAAMAGIDSHIRFRHRVVSANWLSSVRCWEVTVRDDGSHDAHKEDDDCQDQALQVYRSRFIFLGTGYYDYEQPLQAVIPGLQDFGGKLIRPQFWPADYDYTDKEMIIIGSGATAISILPAVADQVKHVTMVQRSPSWYMPVSQRSRLASVLAKVLPRRAACRVNRYRWLVQDHAFVSLCEHAPRLARAVLVRLTSKQLPVGESWERHFQPRYDPWEQRICLVMDGDFFASLRSGKASIVTDRIETATKHGLRMESGREVPADVIVAATGIQLRFGGNIRLSLDGVAVDATQKFAWRASMLQDVPNLVFSFGYQNAAWTMGADCAARVLTRLMRQLEKQGAFMATPRLRDQDAQMQPTPLFSLKSTYVQRMTGLFPHGGTGQWRPRSNYMVDFCAAKWGDMKTSLVME